MNPVDNYTAAELAILDRLSEPLVEACNHQDGIYGSGLGEIVSAVANCRNGHGADLCLPMATLRELLAVAIREYKNLWEPLLQIKRIMDGQNATGPRP